MLKRAPVAGGRSDQNRLGLAELIDPLDERELETLAVAAIKKHRLHLAEAEDAYEVWMAIEEQDSDQARRLKAVYIQAMLVNFAQMAVVEALVDKLGRIPSIDDESASDPLK